MTTRRHVYSATVYQVNESGHRMWPAERFETENKDELSEMKAKAQKRYAKQIKAGTHIIELEEYDVETIPNAIRLRFD